MKAFTLDYFAGKYVVAPNGCWLWTGAKHGGYGRIYWQEGIKKYRATAHRVIASLVFGEIGREVVVRHSCDTPACINPDHLSCGTQRDNVNDRVVRGRGGSHKIAGEKSPRAKLSAEDVREIRNKFGYVNDVLATFGISKTQYRRIINNQAWRAQ